MIRGLVCFDLDGTLVPATTSSHHLAQFLGHAETLEKYEQGYSDGAVSNREVADFDARWYHGKTLTEIHSYLDSIPVIGGIAETVSELHRDGWHTMVGTVAWRFVAAWFCLRFGFKNACGPEIGIDADGCFTGVVTNHFDEWDKLRYVSDRAAALGLTDEACVAVGDGRSDIPLFQKVGTSIALNGTPAAREAAHFSVSSRDLRSVLKYFPAGKAASNATR